MNINRHNYEEFFILYMDNELGSEDRSRVEEFVAQNADLKEELELLLHSKFTPDTTITFSGKEELMKEPGCSFITLSNYEEWLVMYMDNELTPAQSREVEQFIALHPHVQKDLQLFRNTQAQPEATIVFPDKESLYRRTEKVRVISINWRRIAVAAILLLIAGTTAVVLLNKKPVPEKGIAGASDNTNQKSKSVTPVNLVTNNTQKDNQSSEDPVIVKSVEPVNSKVKQTNGQELVKHDNNKANTVVKQKQQDKIQTSGKENTLAIAQNDQKSSNNLPTAENNPYVNDPVSIKKNDIADASFDGNNSKKANALQTAINTKGVTNGIIQSSYTGTAQITQPVDELDQSNSKKGKLRGFLRKVTRTFEKKTNINATDEDERLLVGGLSIKLK